MPNDPKEKQIRLGDIASRGDPRRAPWGYYCSDDNVFGVGLFLWFKTKDDLLRFLAEYEASNSEEHDQDALRLGMRKIAKQISAGKLGFEKGRLRFNNVLKGCIQIEWMGHFEEMWEESTLSARNSEPGFLKSRAMSPFQQFHRNG